ncbi:hypothetical protein imdm_223 [gamma proteobacterium IMCC2047]|nr:hypothetical protein imdm_223 [gamma proteobacterium IMCC2047]
MNFHEGTTVTNQSAGNRHHVRLLSESFLFTIGVGLLQVTGIAVAAETVGKSTAAITTGFFAQRIQFRSALGDQFIFVLWSLLFVAHQLFTFL